jgi:signal transduction histidine kinase
MRLVPSRRLFARLVPRTRRSVDVIVGLLVVVLLAISWPTSPATHDISAAVAPVVAAALVVPLAFVRLHAFAGWGLSALSLLFVVVSLEPTPSYGFPWHPVHLIVFLGLLVVVTLTAPAVQVAVAAVVTAVLLLSLLPWELSLGWTFGVGMLTAVALLVRWLVVSRRRLAQQEEVSELERARRTVLEERSRIARDLHDVVAHSMSLVVVQAQSAPSRIGGVTDEVAQEFHSIGEQARQALNEVRGMLGVLRSDGQLAEDVPQPGIEAVESLLRDTRAAGVDLTWTTTGDPAGFSAASAMVVVRVLQESLANASRHAPGSRVVLEIAYTDAAAEVLVHNTAGLPVAPAAGAHHGGAGLAGMTARVQALGGALSAYPTDDGGFEVHATVPKRAVAHDELADRTP